MKSIEVVAGIIYSQDRQSLLLGFRSAEQHQGNLWEFPGGKVEVPESREAALVRELQEETGITPTDIRFYRSVSHDYADRSVNLHFYTVHSYSGHPQPLENRAVTWVPISELDQHAFPAANQEIVDALLSAS